MATIVMESVGPKGPWLVVLDGELKPHDGIVIENLLKTADWEGRSVVTLDARKLEGFAAESEKALRYAAKVIRANHASFKVLFDPSGPAAVGLSLSGVLEDWQIDFAPVEPKSD